MKEIYWIGLKDITNALPDEVLCISINPRLNVMEVVVEGSKEIPDGQPIPLKGWYRLQCTATKDKAQLPEWATSGLVGYETAP